MPATTVPEMKPGNLPLEAWSSTLARAHVDQLEHSNPEVLLWSIKAADHRQYVLRSAGPWRPGADLADEHRVLLHLSRNGVSVALPVRTDSGALFVTNCERTYVLAPRLAIQAVNHESHPDACAGQLPVAGRVIPARSPGARVRGVLPQAARGCP
jgi:hypothetical protein